MNLERRLEDIRAALKQIDWFSTDEQVDYDLDASSGTLFLRGKISMFNDTILEFTESITPGWLRYRYQYMRKDGGLIFRYDNIGHYPDMITFPHHKHYPDRVVESEPADLRRVVEEIIELFATS
jgi:hypothetical protein